MAHLRDDFSAGSPITQVPASWFNAVAKFVNGLVPGRGIRITRGAESTVVETTADGDIPSASVGTPADHGDSSAVTYDEDGESWSWTAGGANGLKLDCYCKIAPQTSTSNYTVFQRCTLTFSKDGLLVSCKLLPDRIRIQAKNA